MYNTGKRPPAPMGARGRRTSKRTSRRRPTRTRTARGGAGEGMEARSGTALADRPDRDESARLAHDKPPHALRPRDGAERFWLSASLGDAQAVVKVALGLVKAGAENVTGGNDSVLRASGEPLHRASTERGPSFSSEPIPSLDRLPNLADYAHKARRLRIYAGRPVASHSQPHN
jgi:hypothetical protein